MAKALKKWPVFICYRQVDGMEAADHIAKLLNGQKVSATDPETGRDEQFVLSVYQDKNATTSGDWTTTHRENLERARAFIMICTAGASIDERKKGHNDWVQHEIDWWLENRHEIAPILIDALGAGDRYVPQSILDKWPNAQRTPLIAAEWNKLKGPELEAEQSRISDLLRKEVTRSREEFLAQELAEAAERESKLSRALDKQKKLSIAASILLLIAIATAIFAYGKSEETERQRQVAIEARDDARGQAEEAERQRNLAVEARDEAERKQLRAEGAELRGLLQRLDSLIRQSETAYDTAAMARLQTERKEIEVRLAKVTTEHQLSLARAIGFRGDLEFIMRWEGHIGKIRQIGASVVIDPATDLSSADARIIRDRYAFLLTPDELEAVLSIVGIGGAEATTSYQANPILQRIRLAPADVARLVPEVAAPHWQRLVKQYPMLRDETTPPAVHTALLSVVFNMGSSLVASTLSTHVSNRDWAALADSIESFAQDPRYQRFKGLAKRRREEAALIRNAQN